MADSSSESEASFNIEEVPEDNRDHVRQVLAKAKHMAPFYSESVLYKLYKSYFQTDNVFYNELQIIINRRKEQDDGEGWITIGNTKKQTKKGKYNFLQDKKLIWRATNWDKEEAKQRYNKKNQNPRENFRKNNASNEEAPKYRLKDNSKSNNSYVEKKQNFEEKPKKFREKTGQGQKQTPKEEPATKQKYAEKNEIKETTRPQKEQVKEQIKAPALIKEQKKNPMKYAEKSEVKKQSKNTSNSQKYKEKVKQPVKEVEIVSVKQENVKKQQVIEKKTEPQPQPLQKAEPAKTISKPIVVVEKTEIDKKFMQSMKTYPKILKFIKPEGKIQKISYVYNNGSIDNVRVHVPLNQ